MIPLFPRAPINVQSYSLLATSVAVALPFRPSNSSTPLCMVRYMFVPVSPSGTGKTFSALMASTLRRSAIAPAANISARSLPFIRCLPSTCVPASLLVSFMICAIVIYYE